MAIISNIETYRWCELNMFLHLKPSYSFSSYPNLDKRKWQVIIIIDKKKVCEYNWK